MRLRVALVVLLLAAPASPLLAASTWYDHYLDARDKHIPAKRWSEALASLKEAERLKPEPALNEQTYGLQFVHYLPYYLQGLCYLRLGDNNSAIRMFNIEEKKGPVRRSPYYRDLLKFRQEAESAQREFDTAAKVRRLTEEVDRLRREAADLHKSGKWEEALARLAQAKKAADELPDAATQTDIAERAQRIRDDRTRAEEALGRARKIEKDLADGLKLLQEGKPPEAKVKFESVLELEPTHAAALEGKRRAEDEILASTTKAIREGLLAEGRALFERGDYQQALKPLAEAAADSSEAQELLDRSRKYLAGIQTQKDERVRVEGLLADADRLLEERRYADAWVRLTRVLELDPTNMRAQERLRVADRLTGEEMFDRIFPNEPPVLAFVAPRGEGTTIEAESDGARFDVIGLVHDDRGLARIQFFAKGQLVAQQEIVPDPRTGQLQRSYQISRTFELARGENEIKVVITDSLGASTEQTFRVIRRLQFYEQAWFLPSAAATSVSLVGLGFAVQRARRRRAVRNRFNPYIAGAPVMEDDMFFGRRKLLNRILNVLHHNSLMITGERRIGKTTLLHHLKKALEHDEGTEYQFVPVSTDLQGVPEASFFHAVMSDVVEAVAPSPDTASALRFRTGREAYDGRDFSHDLQRIIEELKTRTPKKVKLVLLIDEVDVLNEYSERVNQRLRSIFMKTFSEHLVAIMSGVGIKRIWKSEGSPWYNFFDEIELTAFTREEAEALIKEPVEGVFRYDPEAVELILAHSALKPYVIQKFCIHAVNQMLEAGRTTITTEDVESVRETVTFERPEEVLAEESHASV